MHRSDSATNKPSCLITSSSSTMIPGLPQHLMDDIVQIHSMIDRLEAMSSSIRRQRRIDEKGNAIAVLIKKRNSLSSMTAALAFLSHACLITKCGALSVSTLHAPASGGAQSLLDQARMIREMRASEGAKTLASVEETRRKLLASSPALVPSSPYDDAWMTALFDDPSENLENIRRAEEFDRLMEEDANLASIVKDNLKPGSLVDDVQQAKGADFDMELILQMEAVKRRAAAAVVASSQMTTSDEDFSRKNYSPVVITHSRKSTLPAISYNEPELPTSSNKPALLTREQEYELARAIQRGTHVHKIKADYESTHSQPLTKRQWAKLAGLDSPNELRKIVSEYRRAKQELVSSNMGLVHAVVKSYMRKAYHRGISKDELVQEGSLGLIRAAELFDPEKGLRFSTYATIWIKGVLSNASLDEVITLPNREKVKWNKIRFAWKELEALELPKTGSIKNWCPTTTKAPRKKNPSVEALAKQLGMKPNEVENSILRMACVGNVLSLDYQYASTNRAGQADGNREYAALLSNPNLATDADLAEQAQFKADIVAALVRNLNEKELQLMRLRYGLQDGQERTIKECAREMGINRETARLLQKRCLEKLREASNMESLQEYLLTVA